MARRWPNGAVNNGRKGMLELYHNDMSTCAQKVRLTLAERAWNGKGIT